MFFPSFFLNAMKIIVLNKTKINGIVYFVQEKTISHFSKCYV